MHRNLFPDCFLKQLKDTVPGFQLTCGRRGDILASLCGGHAVIRPHRELVTDRTLFDCASLTKPLITSTLTMHLKALSRLNIDRIAHAGACLPFPFGTPTVRDLLEHRAGFPSWQPLPAFGTQAEVLRFLPAFQVRPPGKITLYSCLDYIYLGYHLEQFTHKSLSALAQDMIFRPLEIERSAFFPIRSAPAKRRTAATECKDLIQPSMTVLPLPRRNTPIRGEPHDVNCLYLGGVSGNAGLFATSDAIYKMVLHLVSLLPPRGLSQRPYCYGLKSGESGTTFPPGTLGHTGFTGTFFFHEPGTGLTGVMLTNRLHTPSPPDMTALRKKFVSACQNILKQVK